MGKKYNAHVDIEKFLGLRGPSYEKVSAIHAFLYAPPLSTASFGLGEILNTT